MDRINVSQNKTANRDHDLGECSRVDDDDSLTLTMSDFEDAQNSDSTDIEDEIPTEKLDSSNYYSWRIRAKARLIQKKLWHAIDPGFGVEMTTEESKINDRTIRTLSVIVDKAMMLTINHLDRARARWKSLYEVHTCHEMEEIMKLERRLYSIKLNDCDSVSQYLYKIDCIQDELEIMGKKWPDEKLSHLYLMGLSDSYKSLRDKMWGEKLPSNKVAIRLLREERQRLRDELDGDNLRAEEEQPIKTMTAKRDKWTYGKERSDCREPRKYETVRHDNKWSDYRENGRDKRRDDFGTMRYYEKYCKNDERGVRYGDGRTESRVDRYCESRRKTTINQKFVGDRRSSTHPYRRRMRSPEMKCFCCG